MSGDQDTRAWLADRPVTPVHDAVDVLAKVRREWELLANFVTDYRAYVEPRIVFRADDHTEVFYVERDSLVAQVARITDLLADTGNDQ